MVKLYSLSLALYCMALSGMAAPTFATTPATAPAPTVVKTGTAARPQALIIGDTFVLKSKILKEQRRINVYFPPGYHDKPDKRLPLMVMPDGGIGEDFLHVAGLLQIGSINETMRPLLLVGIENTERRRDLTGPTENAEDKKVAKRVGGSAAFRAFIRDELLPHIEKHYRVTDERALVGESLAGLFVVETFLLEPDLFQHYIAIDPSLWWNDKKLLASSGAHLSKHARLDKRLYFTTSGQQGMPELSQSLAETLGKVAPAGVQWHYEQMPQETHATIYHPAALKAFRMAFKPPVADKK
ncbi:MAG: hypothetical protein RL748_635 [Pseudomonadota bacterium]|jgi:predicted alpha/beta superfamily hydrolase